MAKHLIVGTKQMIANARNRSERIIHPHVQRRPLCRRSTDEKEYKNYRQRNNTIQSHIFVPIKFNAGGHEFRNTLSPIRSNHSSRSTKRSPGYHQRSVLESENDDSKYCLDCQRASICGIACEKAQHHSGPLLPKKAARVSPGCFSNSKSEIQSPKCFLCPEPEL